MGKRIDYLTLSYPNFVTGTIIDPDEANQNNYEMVTKLNDFVDWVELAMDNSEEALETGNSAYERSNIANDRSISAEETSNEALDKSIEALGQDEEEPYTGARGAIKKSIETSSQLDSLLGDLDFAIYRAEQAVIDAQSAIGNTKVSYDVYVIVSSDNGDGTFTYSDGEEEYTGYITDDGNQVFQLTNTYLPGENRIEATINDTLLRSEASGGLKEIGEMEEPSSSVELTYPIESGSEISFKYYTSLSLSHRHAMSHNVGATDAFIKIQPDDPEKTYAGQFLYREV